MKSLSIPYLPELNAMGAQAAFEIVDEFGARFSIETLNWPETFAYKPLTTVCVARNKTSLFILFQVHSNCLRAVHTKDNENVHEDSCVEFFVKTPESDYYYNFEFNCIGVCKAGKHYKTREDVVYFTPDQLGEIDRWSSVGQRAFQEINGLFSWDVSIQIPFHLINMDANQLPPKILGNFYKCAAATAQPHYVTWNPIKTEKPDFHRPEFFGEIWLH